MTNTSTTDTPDPGHGIRCPECQHLITVTLPVLLGGTVFCSACGLKLSVDQDKSQEGLAALRALWDSQQACETEPAETLPAGHVKTQLKGK